MSASKNNDKPDFSKKNDFPERIFNLINSLGSGLYEREQTLAIALLGAITGQNTFLYGPPGTAKSLIARRLSMAFESKNYFECLMNRFSTPEELFGPVSLKALKEDRYVRQIEGYLPSANFAFLDEIWKSSPAILNNLLTIVNEHTFKNGADLLSVPLKSLISASNEVPAENQGLEALYDRFILRLLVPPIEKTENFFDMLNRSPSQENVVPSNELIIKDSELETWRKKIHEVSLGKETVLIISDIRKTLSENFDELKVYVSDRRWQRASLIMKASAFFNGRQETNHSDSVLLKHCLWSSPDNREKVWDIVLGSIEKVGFDSGHDLSDIDKEKSRLDGEIKSELYHSDDVYETVNLKDGHDYFQVDFYDQEKRYLINRPDRCYIPFSDFKLKSESNPRDYNGNPLKEIVYKFDGQGSCCIFLKDNYRGPIKIKTFVPRVLFHKGAKKRDVNKRLVDSLVFSVYEVKGKLQNILKNLEERSEGYREKLKSPFITSEEADVAIRGVSSQVDQVKQRIKDCERLEDLCR